MNTYYEYIFQIYINILWEYFMREYFMRAINLKLKNCIEYRISIIIINVFHILKGLCKFIKKYLSLLFLQDKSSSSANQKLR